MKILIALTTVALLAALAFRSQSSENGMPFPPEVLKAVPGLSELQLVRLHQKLAPLGRQFPRATPEQKRQLIAEYRRLLESELTREQFDLAARLPHDEEGLHRFYRHRLLETADLRPQQRALLQRLTTLADRLSPTDPRQLRQRYWQLVALILDGDQMARFNRGLPELARTAGDEPPDYLGLPGVSGSQANRLLAQFHTLDAETAADRTRAQQLEKEMATADEDGLAVLQSQLLELRVSMLQRKQQMHEEIQSMLSEAQRQTLDSYPPGNRPRQLVENVERLVAGVALKPEQKQMIEAWRQQNMPRFLAVKDELEQRHRQMAETDVRAPGGMERLLAVREIEEPIERARLEMARQLVLTFEDQQMEGWLLGLFPLEPASARARFEEVGKALEKRRQAGEDVRELVSLVAQAKEQVEQGKLIDAHKSLERAEASLRLAR
ncbi:hypothetical protein IV102_37620 [bacterium]|nr:hypothetical protein [bacterium]